MILGVRIIICSKIRELCYALMLTIYNIMLHKIDHYKETVLCSPLSSATLLFRHCSELNNQMPSADKAGPLTGSALVLLELSEASCRESSPSLETVVNVADARLSDGVYRVYYNLAPRCLIVVYIFLRVKNSLHCPFGMAYNIHYNKYYVIYDRFRIREAK